MSITINGNGTVTGLTAAPNLTSSGLTTGKILQVKQTSKSDFTSLSGSDPTSYADISGMSVSITPTSSSNKILVSFIACVSCDTTNRNASIRLMRDSTNICIGTAGSSRNAAIIDRTRSDQAIDNYTQQVLDSPNTTSAITYKLQWATESSGGSASVYYLNRKGASTNDGAASSITVMEVAA